MIRPPNRIELLRLLPKGGVCAETGVFRGEHAKRIVEILEPATMFLVDPWDTPIEWFIDGELRQCPGDESLQIVQEKFATDSRVVIVRDSSPGALQHLPPLDVVYIDGDHRYEAVLDDLEVSLSKIRPGGWICGHDYCEIFDSAVPRAVSVFCLRHGLQLSLLTDEPKYPARGARRGLNANVPDQVAYNSFGILIK